MRYYKRMKTCNIEGCTAPESALMPCVCIGGIVYSCKYHLLLLKIVLKDKLLLHEEVIKSYYIGNIRDHSPMTCKGEIGDNKR